MTPWLNRNQHQYSETEFEIRKDYFIPQTSNLRFAMSPQIRKKRKPEKSDGLEVNTENVKILRTVENEEAFYFYEAIGKPTRESARSLSDFLEKVKSVKLESLAFHLQRKDFQNWINKILGDSKLANRIGRIPLSQEEKIRTKIQEAVESRIKELREPPLTLLVGEDLAVVSTSSMS
jgi:hypothetical protein